MQQQDKSSTAINLRHLLIEAELVRKNAANSMRVWERAAAAAKQDSSASKPKK
jgi:hypothetical protein